ncbi:hypothetical protein IU500_07165 [Nocardia terpenica]|uniref:hypothetical protein n=1 Tax=Nocardia terpenica TaxID=455432 RepID=UPI00083274D4|nr:hypothetical protein [Nocardia terpenica]MBF6060557.1 hypothetical protein [Nocardia terpenica]MBF6103817.1 hypothetical protein [Nocardia terpenica]MBF6111809.1 hypothetical protein [Nocardia terpenica]MBF6118038.1 hypothetical protein [Nocardia terpenica]MBF6155236.1 hypothetical protein [Nocardia terpenica]
MTRYTDLDDCAAAALTVCERVREMGPLETYRHLAAQCARDPERMAQILMALAAFVDIEAPLSVLRARVDAIVEDRVRAAGRVVTA